MYTSTYLPPRLIPRTCISISSESFYSPSQVMPHHPPNLFTILAFISIGTVLPIIECYINRIIQYILFCLLLFNINVSMLTYIIEYTIIWLFLVASSIPLCDYNITMCLFLLLWVTIWVVPSWRALCINLLGRF